MQIQGRGFLLNVMLSEAKNLSSIALASQINALTPEPEERFFASLRTTPIWMIMHDVRGGPALDAAAPLS